MGRIQFPVFTLFIVMSIFAMPSWCVNNAPAKTACPNEDGTIELGYLVAFENKDESADSTAYDLIGRVISGAMTLAIDTINNDSSLLPGYHLMFHFWNTRSEEDDVLRGVTNLWKEGVDGFIGPDVTCTIGARLAHAWNLPMIAYRCYDPEVNNKDLYSTFARTSPTARKSIRSVIALLKNFNWLHVTIVSSNRNYHRTVTKVLIEDLPKDKVEVQTSRTFKPVPILLQPEDNDTNPFQSIIESTYKKTRIYLFLGEEWEWMGFMQAAETEGLLDKGEYLVVALNFVTFKDKWAKDGLPWFYLAPDKAKSYMRHTLWLFNTEVINPNYDEFTDKATELVQNQPFNVSFGGLDLDVPIEAAFLYDAVMLYALALNTTLSDGECARNGTAVMNNMFNRTYESITGLQRHIDINGDSSASVSVYGIFQENLLERIGTFHDDETFETLPSKDITWFSGRKPLAVPVCGFDNEFCQRNWIPIYIGLTVFFLVLIAVLCLSLTILQELEI
ncbi:putative speract receptor [Apostichopus japonicus]|uniref:Putative speract receptor n=1 Tax=Stichopus japonicus TaxID=307972 RepID=A0A2G8KBW4_STIJA|nr:putative speract receptor [Apostichopus japonicus]